MFLDYSVHSKLDSDGYCIINLLDEFAIDQLTEVASCIQEKHSNTFFNGIHMTIWCSDIAFKLSIRDKIESIIKPYCNRFFQNYKLLNSVYIIKQQNRTSGFPLHQDWSFVDEAVYPAINIWVALQDTFIHNGGLCVVKGSHRLNNYIRGAGRLSFDFNQYSNALKPYLTPLSLKKGQAVLFYYSTIHGSPANRTTKARSIIASTIIPEDANIVLNYFDNKTNSLHQYLMCDDFVYKYNDIRFESVLQPPNGKLLQCIPDFEPYSVSLGEIIAVSKLSDNSMLDKFLNLFKLRFL